MLVKWERLILTQSRKDAKKPLINKRQESVKKQQESARKGGGKAAGKCLKWGKSGGGTEGQIGTLAAVTYWLIMVYKRFSMDYLGPYS